jgi:hypothetical protein
MIKAHEFTVGGAHATPVSLLLPRSKHEATFLIGRIEDRTAAVLLDGDYRFRSFECAEPATWKGFVPNVRMEIDEVTLGDPQSSWQPVGSYADRAS